ncbi:hypothetical protein HMPREF1141_2534 [Clostridium sp. MSTE9]|nr:hypothetical protein HMPREF1141_2534 [Clostridium sp. MSTE9]
MQSHCLDPAICNSHGKYLITIAFRINDSPIFYHQIVQHVLTPFIRMIFEICLRYNRRQISRFCYLNDWSVVCTVLQ